MTNVTAGGGNLPSIPEGSTPSTTVVRKSQLGTQYAKGMATRRVEKQAITKSDVDTQRVIGIKLPSSPVSGDIKSISQSHSPPTTVPHSTEQGKNRAVATLGDIAIQKEVTEESLCETYNTALDEAGDDLFKRASLGQGGISHENIYLEEREPPVTPSPQQSRKNF